MSQKTAFITGITGQDGSYLSRFLLNKGYRVHGLQRRSSSHNTGRIDDLLEKTDGLQLHYGDVTDASNLIRLISEIRPDEIYNLAAQSHVAVSFETPEYTAQADALGPLRILEAIRILKLENHTRFIQASTSELYGTPGESPQNEETPFMPRSPYAAAKLYAYWVTRNYREAYGMHACNAIMFNHESPLRGDDFVTQKAIKSAVNIVNGIEEKIAIGNLEAKRDWSHAHDMVRGMHMIINHDAPDDFVLASGQTRSVRELISYIFDRLNMPLTWQGSNMGEKGIDANGNLRIEIDANFLRPTDVDHLCGDASKAREILGWRAEISFEQMIDEMIAAHQIASLKGSVA